MIGRWKRASRLPEQRRQQMIDEHSQFLTWALRHGHDLPRIPSRRVDQGGFGYLYRVSAARERVNQWWWRTLARVEAISDRK